MEKYKAKYLLDGQIHVTQPFEAENPEDAENAILLALEHDGHKDAEILRIEVCHLSNDSVGNTILNILDENIAKEQKKKKKHSDAEGKVRVAILHGLIQSELTKNHLAAELTRGVTKVMEKLFEPASMCAIFAYMVELEHEKNAVPR